MLTLDEMLAIEENAVELKVSRRLMMENAGASIANYLKTHNLIGKVTILAGTGNKAGDGFVAARHIVSLGGKAIVILSEKEENIKTKEAKANFEILKYLDSSVKIYSALDLNDEEIKNIIGDSKVIIDALIGTGIRGKLKENIARLVRLFNSSNSFKLSIDVPTGIDPTTGNNFGEYAKPNVVITMHRIKKGLLKYEKEFEIIEANIGIPPEAEIYAGRGDVKVTIPKRNPLSKKGDNGIVLVIGGSKIYHGAPSFTALAASRSGVDLVYVLVPDSIATAIRSSNPQLIVIPYKEEKLNAKVIEENVNLIKKCDVIAIGPGLGEGVEEGVEEVFKYATLFNKFLVIDADALKTEIAKSSWNEKRAIYTPHAGEFKILTGKDLPSYDLIEERIKLVKEESKRLNVVMLLKGHIDIITDGEKVKLNKTGTQAMTVGGTGDILTGLCAGILSRSKKLFESAVSAAYINGKAGEYATKKFGNQITAVDLLQYIPKIIKKLDPTYA